ncbi:MAG: hypothetical protein ABGZ24_00350, partial [Fuerstiella sp.]
RMLYSTALIDAKCHAPGRGQRIAPIARLILMPHVIGWALLGGCLIRLDAISSGRFEVGELGGRRRTSGQDRPTALTGALRGRQWFLIRFLGFTILTACSGDEWQCDIRYSF